MRNGVLILECPHEGDPGSEGRFLLHTFGLMSVDSRYIEVRTKRQLLSLLDRPQFRIIHLTTHGRVVDDRFAASRTSLVSGRVRRISPNPIFRYSLAVSTSTCAAVAKSVGSALQSAQQSHQAHRLSHVAGWRTRNFTIPNRQAALSGLRLVLARSNRLDCRPYGLQGHCSPKCD
jgi:hypothetical protein